MSSNNNNNNNNNMDITSNNNEDEDDEDDVNMQNDDDDDDNNDNNDNNDDNKDHIHIISDIAAGWVSVLQSIIPHLSDQLIVLIYKTIKPLLSVHESILLQKRAYHVLESIIIAHPDLLQSNSISTINTNNSSNNNNTNNSNSNNSSNTKMDSLVDIYNMITNNLDTCHVSARNIRLRCIDILIQHLNSEDLNNNVVDTLLPEILTCMKDANKKTREHSYKILKFLIHNVITIKILTLLSTAVLSNNQIMSIGGITSLCVLYLEIFHTKRSIFEKKNYSNIAEEDNESETNNRLINKNKDFYKDGYELLIDQVVNVLNTICVFLKNEVVEQTRAVLSFIRGMYMIYYYYYTLIIFYTIISHLFIYYYCMLSYYYYYDCYYYYYNFLYAIYLTFNII